MAGFVSELMVVFNRCGWSVWCLIHAVILVIANIYLFEGMGKNSLFGFVAIGLFGFRGINLSQPDFDLLVAVLQQREGVAVITAK
jgi:hypothetical protein